MSARISSSERAPVPFGFTVGQSYTIGVARPSLAL
jgi:hypothetical protein